MRALTIFLAVLHTATAFAGEERNTVAELTKAHSADVAIVEGNGGSGSAFIARIGKGRYLITNQHVVAGMDAPVFTSPNRTRLKIGTAAAAAEHDVMSFGIEQTGSALDVMQDVDKHVSIGDDVAVLGNPNGEGVIHPITGKVVGIGPQLVEVSAEFVSGNSGSPIVHMRTGKVIGVATYIRYEPPSIVEGKSAASSRRFGYRLDSIRKWLPVRMWEFNDEAATIDRLRGRTLDLATIILHMRANRALSPSRLKDTEVRGIYERHLANVVHLENLTARVKNGTSFLDSLLQASTADVAHARRRISYDYFLDQLEREVAAREPFPRILEILLKARPQL
jgi:hypothetical protein